MRYRIASGLLAATAVALTGATAASAATTTTTGSNIGVIRVGSKCLDVTGSKIKVATCILSVRQEPRHLPTVTLSTRWTINANQTISDGNAGCLITKPGKAGSPRSLGSCGSPYAGWLPLPGNRLENLTATLSPQAPACLTVGARKLYLQSCPKASAITVAHEHVAVSDLISRPDSGGSGGNWALDTMLRGAAVTWTGGDTYEGAITDSGMFATIPGNATPNQGLDPGKTIGDLLPGSISGHWGFTFTASSAVTTKPPATVKGVADSTGTWYELFFPGSTTFGGQGGASVGPAQWSWSYTSRPDNCGDVETWVDANNDGGGQATSGRYATDITAPAPGACS